MKVKTINKEILSVAVKELFKCENFLLVTEDATFICGTSKQLENILIAACGKDENLIELFNEVTRESELARMNDLKGNRDNSL